MASPVLHIKDAYYFDVPKALWRSQRSEMDDFPEFWIRLDPDYQLWEAEHLSVELAKLAAQTRTPGSPQADLFDE